MSAHIGIILHIVTFRNSLYAQYFCHPDEVLQVQGVDSNLPPVAEVQDGQLSQPHPLEVDQGLGLSQAPQNREEKGGAGG